jgi:hypothetical protein
MHMEEADMDVAILLGEMLGEHLAHGEVGGDDVVGEDGRQLEHLRAREQAGGVAVHGPDEVDDAVAHLPEQLRRRAAERHRRVDLDLHAAAGILFDSFGPGRQHLGLRGRLGAEKVVQLEVDLGGPRAPRAQDERRRQGGRARAQQLPAVEHVPSSLSLPVQRNADLELPPLVSARWFCIKL